MRFRIERQLAFVTARLTYLGRTLTTHRALLDSGSAGTVFATDRVLEIGLSADLNDPIRRIRGIGGEESVIAKRIEQLAVGDLVVSDFTIEIGALDYGYTIEAIIGLDFFLQTGAVIDFSQLEITAPGLH